MPITVAAAIALIVKLVIVFVRFVNARLWAGRVPQGIKLALFLPAILGKIAPSP
jgi:hypothetical protein